MNAQLIYRYVACEFQINTEKIKLPEEVQEAVYENWKKLRSTGKNFTNDPLFSVVSIKEQDKKLMLTVKETTYDHYLYSMEQHFEGDHICRSIAANVLLKTLDGYFVLAKMASKTALPGKIKFIGGAFNQADIVNGHLDPFRCVLRELQEEVGLELEAAALCPQYFLTRKNFSFINVLFTAKLNLSCAELSKVFEKYRQEDEVDALCFLKDDPKKIRQFLSKNKQRTVEYLPEFFQVYLGDLAAKDIFSRG